MNDIPGRVNRRLFLEGMAGSCGMLLMSKFWSYLPYTTSHLFLASSGLLAGRHRPQVMGVLSCADPAPHVAALTALRTTHHYWKALQYRSRDRYQPAFTTAVLDYFFSQTDLQFTALVLQGAGVDAVTGAYTRAQRYAAVHLAAQAMAGLSIYLPPDEPGGTAANYTALIREQSSPWPTFQILSPHQHQLLQLADLLTGQVWADHTGLPVTNSTKKNLLQHTKDHLHIQQFADLYQVQLPKFKVTQISVS